MSTRSMDWAYISCQLNALTGAEDGDRTRLGRIDNPLPSQRTTSAIKKWAQSQTDLILPAQRFDLHPLRADLQGPFNASCFAFWSNPKLLSRRPSLQTRFVSLGSNPFCISAGFLHSRIALLFFLLMCIIAPITSLVNWCYNTLSIYAVSLSTTDSMLAGTRH